MVLFSTEMKKCQLELLLLSNEILKLREPLVGSLTFFHFGTEQERASKNYTKLGLQRSAS